MVKISLALTSDTLSARFHEKGAELNSLINHRSGHNYIWHADPEVWNRHAPVLFPIVGRLKSDAYYHDNWQYPMLQHGFARKQDFALTTMEQEVLKLVLRHNEETLKQYPYNFSLEATHELLENGLRSSFTVSNNSDKQMPFSIGGHPGFMAPPGYEDIIGCWVHFEGLEKLERHLLKGGLRTGEKEMIDLENGWLQIDEHTFGNDALVFNTEHVQQLSFTGPDRKPYVTLIAEQQVPWWGVWSQPGATPYVCLEPWFGVADATDASGDFADKTALQQLAPQQEFTFSYRIQLHDL